MCFSYFIFTLYLMSQLLIYCILNLLKNTIQTMHLLCIYIVWYSLLICLCHKAVSLCYFQFVEFSLTEHRVMHFSQCKLYYCSSFQKFQNAGNCHKVTLNIVRLLPKTSSPNIFICMLSNIVMSQRMYICMSVYWCKYICENNT